MNKIVVSCLLLAVFALLGGTAAAEPGWCAVEGIDKAQMRNTNVKDALDADPRNALPAIVATLCWPDNEARQHTARSRRRDQAYAKMFEIAAATRKTWDGLWRTETGLLDLALAMDDARQTSSRKSLDGCSETTWAAWKTAVERIAARSFEGFSTKIEDSWLEPAMAVITTTPHGYLAATALYTCHKTTADKDAVLNTTGAVMMYAPGLRGPRTASMWALRGAGLQLDDSSAKLDFPEFRYDRKYPGSARRGYYATVAKIKIEGDKAVVSFAPKFENQEQCSSGRRTNRITQIRSDGSLIYETECLKWSMITVDRSPEPQTVDARYVTGVKPGMNVYIGGGALGAAWNKGKKSPSVVAGVSLK